MTDNPETLERYRIPWRRDPLKQGGPMASFVRAIPRNPLILLGAVAVGVAGVVAWRNRDKIAAKAQPLIEGAKAKAQPLIEDAKAKGQALVEDAKLKGEALIEEAKEKTEAVAARVRARRKAAPEIGAQDLH